MIDTKLKNLNTEDEISLDSQQIDVLLREIKRTDGHWFVRLIWKFFPSIWRKSTEGLLELVAPDAEITVNKDGHISKYQLFARTILVDMTTGRPRQFYMGLLLLEWLKA